MDISKQYQTFVCMKATDTLKFAYRFMNVNQKRELKTLADANNNSLNQEITSAIVKHINKNKKHAN